jgi:predicted ester cyclase
MKKLLMVIPLVFLFCLTFSCQQQGEEDLTLEDARAIIDNFLKFRNEGDLMSADKVMHPECVIRYPNLPEEIVGLEAYKEYDKMTRIAFPDFKMTIDDFFVKDDKIVLYWALDATNTGSLMTPMGELSPTNKKFRISGIAVSHIVAGKIKEDVAYFDMLNMMQQLGFTLTPPQPQEPPEEKK